MVVATFMEDGKMPLLPNFQSNDRIMNQLQTTWSGIIDPVITAPQNNSIILKSVSLTVGTNVINHLLGQKLQGWSLTRKRGPASIYDQQDTNQQPSLTLILITDIACVCDIEVF